MDRVRTHLSVFKTGKYELTAIWSSFHTYICGVIAPTLWTAGGKLTTYTHTTSSLATVCFHVGAHVTNAINKQEIKTLIARIYRWLCLYYNIYFRNVKRMTIIIDFVKISIYKELFSHLKHLSHHQYLPYSNATYCISHNGNEFL